MASTQTFQVRSSDKKLIPTQDNDREYFLPSGKYTHNTDMLISVFGYNHITAAEEIYNTLVKAGIEHKYSKITVEV